jgi:hypothetical protein
VGFLEGACEILLQGSRKPLGEPSRSNLEWIEAIDEKSTLFRLADRLFEVSNWDQFLSIL